MNCNVCNKKFDAITSDNEFICSVCGITKEAVPITGVAENCPLLECMWCGWVGEQEDLDFDQHDEQCFCPICGHAEFRHPIMFDKT